MLYFSGTILVTKEASPLRGNMNKYMDTLLKSSLFSSITADDVDSVLDCLGAIIKKYQKNECILMAGNTTEYIGLLLTGKAIVIQEDYWGGQSVILPSCPDTRLRNHMPVPLAPYSTSAYMLKLQVLYCF